MQSRRQFLALAAVSTASALFAGCASTPSFSGDALMSTLTGQGLTTNQAAGGLGAVMSLAQSKLPASDYASLANYLPSSEKYLKVAQDAGLLSNPVRDVQQLNSAFSKLGLDAGQARNLLGATSDYLTKTGGESARSLLARALT
jgi:outer membrane murein-binding lipoprotein Lpp